MAEKIYNVYSLGLVIFSVAIVAHYVFLEPGWRKWQYYYTVACMFVLTIVEFLDKSEESALLCVFFSGLNISFARKKHHIRGFFLVFPIMGICTGIVMPISFLPEWLFGLQEHGYEIMLDFITIFLLLLFIWKGKKWRQEFELELQYRKLQKWESRLLTFIGINLFLSMTFWDSVKMMNDMSIEMKSLIVIGALNAIVLTIIVIMLVMQGNKRAYYANIAALNEGYLKAEEKHFLAYQESQTETRRIRHDMKNHLQSMLYLSKAQKYSELEKYLENISFSVTHIDNELHCGNYLADAICNEKRQVALRKGISLEIDGRMPQELQIEPVDICTIFANALDNAIEALENENLQKRWIKISVSFQGEIIYLCFSNPVVEGITQKNFTGTSKKDIQNHGFGLQNIRIAVEKYHGELQTKLQNEKEGIIFNLEIMLLNHSQQK